MTEWFQKEITLKQKARGCHLITDEIAKIKEVSDIKIGLCHVHSECKLRSVEF